MKQKFPKHLSYNYKLNIDNVPTKANDRLSLRVIVPALLVGLLMMLLGVFELNNALYTGAETIYKSARVIHQPLVGHLVADYAFILIGLSIIAGAVIAHIRYKKIYFNGRIFDVDFKGVFGEVEMFSENLRNYRGVRMRIEFCQFGILTKNKYIIELEHIDPDKTIPLYISTNSIGIFDIWHYYAKRLEKPTIMDTDEGLKVVDSWDLNKSLKNYLVTSGNASDYALVPQMPKVFKYIQRSDKTVLVSKKSFWDAISSIAAMWLCVYALALFLVFYNYARIVPTVSSVWLLNGGLTLATLLLIVCVLWLFRKEKIVIKEKRIILIYKFLLLSRKNGEVDIDALKDIEVLHSPVTNRYYLALISQYGVASFGAKMPLDNLRWVKKFLIHEVLK